MNNTCGKRVEETLILKKELEEKYDLPVYLMDERLSTTEAEKVLLLGDTSRKKRKKSNRFSSSYNYITNLFRYERK